MQTTLHLSYQLADIQVVHMEEVADMAEKKKVDVTKSSLQQARDHLGTVCYKLECDLNDIKNTINTINNDWDSDLAKSMVQKQSAELNDVITDQAIIIERIRNYFDTINLKYTTLEQKLSESVAGGAAKIASDVVTAVSNADMFK